jgi:hypothetical protein
MIKPFVKSAAALAKSIPSKVSSFTSTSFANSKSICVGVTFRFEVHYLAWGRF